MSIRDLRAPSQDGAILAEPSLDEVSSLLRLNRQRLAVPAPNVLGRPWDDLRRTARHQAAEAARDYLDRAGEPTPAGFGIGCGSEPPRLLLAGHQPDLFHPGVWFKNFALHGLARRHGACPINLIVDNDTVKATAVRIPSYQGEGPGAAEGAVALTVPFDRRTDEVPYEERAVADEALFADFPDRAAAAFRGWGFVPMLGSFWAEVRRQARRTDLLGERFAAARRTFERGWGCHNLELPVSQLCRTEGFAWFACHLLADLPRFHGIYNDCLSAYRRRYGVRSRNHPVPELIQEGEWQEAPFWVWHSGPGRRARLLVRRTVSGLEIRAGPEPGPVLPFDPGRPEGLVAAWRELEARGFKVRSRALSNTLYARLFLADLFVHGLGGAKYDELTDDILRRFYAVEPPRYLTLTATLRLPLASFAACPSRCQALLRELRDVRYNPQRHLSPMASHDVEVGQLVAERDEWVARQPVTARGRQERFRVLRALNERLQPWVAGQEQRLEHDLADCRRQVHANAVLQRRDYAFCLYPEDLLRGFLGRAR